MKYLPICHTLIYFNAQTSTSFLTYSMYTWIVKISPTGKTCKDPDTYHQLIKTCQTRNTETNAPDILLRNIALLGLEYRQVTPGNGDCFFEAISDQLIRLDRPHQSAEKLRENVVSFCRQQPILQVHFSYISYYLHNDTNIRQLYMN